MKARIWSYGVPVLQAKDVCVSRGGVPVLRDVALEITELRRPESVVGQVVALLGPSGMGKTTLFRVLAGLDAPDRGVVRVGAGLRPVRRGTVGVVAQRSPLFAHRTVLDNLVIAGRQAGLSGAAATQKARSFLDRLRLSDVAGHWPSQLSGGQQQRVAIAQQFLCSDHLLLMDEPFSGLDPIAIRTVSELITEVANLDSLNTIVVVTHDVAAALSVADTLWLLGRDRDAAGRAVPGARVQATYDLLERGLAWNDEARETPEFAALYREIVGRFPSL